MRPIDADALDKRVYEEIPLKYFNGSLKTVSFVRELIEEAPTISPDEVRGVGEWMPAETELGFSCSVCGKLLDEYVHGGEWVSLAKMPNYCPNCGARMKGVSEDA